MKQWVPFAEGDYLAEQAFLKTPSNAAMLIERVVINVYTGAQGVRGIRGSGMIRPAKLVQLHEDDDVMDMFIDLGGEFKYLLKNPQMNAGKVFAEDVRSAVQFFPSVPWEPVEEDVFAQILEKSDFI